MFKLIFSLAFVLLAVLAALFGFLAGKKNKWQLSVSKMIFTVVAGTFSALLAVTVAYLASSFGVSIAMDLLPSFAADINALPLTVEAIKALAATVLSPILFLPLFAVCRALLGFATKPLARLMAGKSKANTETENSELSPKEAKKALLRNPKITASSSICGALTGLLLFTVLAIPCVYSLATAGEIGYAVTEGSNTKTMSTINAVSDGLSSNAATVSLKFVGGELIYNGMTAYPVGNDVLALKDEKEFAVAAICAAKEMLKSDAEYNGLTAQAHLYDAAKAFENTTLLPTVLPEAATAAVAKWDKGETFFGLADLRNKSETFKPAIVAGINVFNGSTPETAKEDVSAVLKSAGALSLRYNLSAIKASPLELLNDQELTEEILKSFLGNKRLNALVIGVTQSGLNMLTAKMNMNTSLDGMYDSMADEITAEVSAFITEEMLYEELPEIPLEPVSLTFTNLQKLNKSENTQDEQTEAEAPEAEGSKEEEKAEKDMEKLTEKLAKRLSKVFGNYGIKLTDDSAKALAENMLSEFMSFKAEEVTTESVTNVLAVTTVTVVKADGTEKPVELASQEAFEESTQIVLVSSITLNTTQATDVDKEAKALSEGLKHIYGMYSSISEEGFDAKNIVKEMGPVLDCLSETEMIGAENTETLMVGVLQSDTAREAVKMPIVEITEVATQICELSKEENYSSLMGTLSNTIEVVENAKEGGDTTASVTELINNLTPASAKTIQTLANPALIQSYGVSEKYAVPTADLVSKLFGNLSTAKQDGNLTDEQYKKEADAIADMMKIALNANKTEKTTFGEDSKTGLTAEEFVNRIVSSQVVSKTAVEAVYGEGDTPTVNPLGASKKLSDAERAELLEALNNEYANTSDAEKAEKAKVLIAAASIINMEIVVTDSGLEEIVPADPAE